MFMKIYFACSITGGRENAHIYTEIVDYLRKHGTVLTEHLVHPDITTKGEDLDDEEIYQRDVDWIREADIVIADVTTPSLGVGYEIGFAEFLGKRILCMCRSTDKRLSAMITGNPQVHTVFYKNLEEVKKRISKFVK